MACLRKIEGKYYIFSRVNTEGYWVVREDGNGYGRLTIGAVSMPSELIGKRVKIIVDVDD